MSNYSTATPPPALAKSKAKRLNPIWQARLDRFRSNRLGLISLIIFSLVFILCMAANVIANDKPLLVSYDGDYYVPVLTAYPETTFGGVNRLSSVADQCTVDGCMCTFTVVYTWEQEYSSWFRVLRNIKYVSVARAVTTPCLRLSLFCFLPSFLPFAHYSFATFLH